VEDKANGTGTLFHPNGAKYEGQFRNNNYHGQGTYTYSDGRKISGLFQDGEFIK
jgi:hypothetical protein